MSKVPLSEKLALTIDEVAAVTGFSRSTIYDLIKAKRLASRKQGRKTVVLRADIDRYLDALPYFESGGKVAGS